MIITLYSPEVSSRLRYIVAHFFTDLLGISVELTTDTSHFQEVSGVAVNYSKQSIREREIHLCPASLLFATGVEEQQLQSGIVDGVPYCFAGPPGYDLPFDPLAAAFFVLSRYEEYLPHEKDQYGRYPAPLSWLSRNAALDRPILWEWAKLVRATIQDKYPAWEALSVHRQYRFLPTYDIDIPWAYCHRGWRGRVRAWMDRLTAGPEHLQARKRAQLNASDDPYFTFPQLEHLHQKNDLQPMVFWLVADRAKFDVNPNPDLPVFQDLVREVANWSTTGLHPSYQRGQDASGITMEKQRLENILQQPIKRSRQHFLRLSLPHTYRQLLAAGIDEDYSMGYAAQPGFRAGTSEPFYWYDLEKEEATALRVYPFAVMDVTLKQYQSMGPTEAQVYLQEMQTYCKREGLSFCTLWHNSSFSPLFGWDEEWWSVYQSLF